MAEADAEGRRATGDEFARRFDRVVAGLGIARTVGEEDAVRLQRKNVRGRCARWYDRDTATTLGEHAQDVELDAEVVGNDVSA